MKLVDLITKYESYLLTEKRVSENTFAAYRQDLNQLYRYCTKQAIELSSFSTKLLKEFLLFLKNQGISARTQARKIATIKGLFSYASSRFDLPDYAEDLTSPKLKKELPAVLSEQEMMRLFSEAEKDTSVIGRRNCTMLYVMYVTGMRVSELISLKITDIHRDSSVVSIEGKGGRQRMVPLPEGMLEHVSRYIDETRSAILQKQTSEWLFPVHYGKKVKALTRQAFWLIIKQVWKKAQIQRPMSPHTLRHSFATHMLKKGANLRSLQILLGHEQLTTVQVYTHVDTSYLRTIYNKKHPRSD